MMRQDMIEWNRVEHNDSTLDCRCGTRLFSVLFQSLLFIGTSVLRNLGLEAV